jgi:hypothetical protein
MVSPDERDAYVSHLEVTAMPVWRSLQKDGLLADRIVLEQTNVPSAIDGLKSWNFLQLARLSEGVDIETYMKAEEERLSAVGFAPPGQLLRVESLESTPRSFYPLPSRASIREDQQLKFFVEFIKVFDGFLDEYRDNMLVNSGPAIGRLIDEGVLYSFIALETRSIDHVHEGMPKWNQIHVMAHHGSIVNFIAAYDRALREVNPESGGLIRVFMRLDQIRKKLKESMNREVRSLRIENNVSNRKP